MITYKYKAISRDGLKVSGIVEAYNEYEAVSRIKQECRLITHIAPVKEKKGILQMEIGSPRVNIRNLSIMCSQFAIILRAGMPVAKCVSLIAEQTQDKKLKKILEHVQKDVAAGHSIADSFENANKKAFPMTFVETIRAGEMAGTVDHSFDSLSVFYEKHYKTKQKISSALTYPAFVLVIAVIVVIVVMVKVIPTLITMFVDMGMELPAMMQILIQISLFVKSHIIVILMLVFGLASVFMVWKRTEKGRISWAKFQLSMPVIGKILKMSIAGSFARTMHTLLSSGLALPQALEVTAKTLENDYLSSETIRMVGQLQEGHHLGELLKKSNCFDSTLNEMCAIGEDTGELEATLDTIADYYDNQADYATQKALAKLEPTMLCILAVIAGFIVIAIYSSLFSMYDAM